MGAVGPAKPADRPDHEVDDPLYLLTLDARWIVVKVSDLKKTYIYFMCVHTNCS